MIAVSGIHDKRGGIVSWEAPLCVIDVPVRSKDARLRTTDDSPAVKDTRLARTLVATHAAACRILDANERLA